MKQEAWTDWTLEWLGNYSFKINDEHDFKIMGGYSYQQFDYEWFSASNRDFPSDAFLYNYLQGGEYEKVNGRLGMESHKEEEKTIAFWGVLIITGMTYSCLQDLYAMKVTLSLVKIINGDFSRQHRLLGVCPNCRCLKTVLPLTI